MLLDRRLLAWGSFGILLGAALVAATFELFGGTATASSACSSGSGQAFEPAQGSFGATGHLDIEFSCGTLAVKTANQSNWSNWSISGVDRDGRAPAIETDPTGVTLRSPDRGSGADGGRTDWSVSVPGSPRLNFGLTMDGGDATVGLGDLDSASFTLNAGSLVAEMGPFNMAGWAGLDMTVNAGRATLSLPEQGLPGAAELSLHAGSMTVCVPVGTAMVVHWISTLASNNFDQAGLTKTGDNTWSAAGTGSSGLITLDVHADAGSFSILGGSCSA